MPRSIILDSEAQVSCGSLKFIDCIRCCRSCTRINISVSANVRLIATLLLQDALLALNCVEEFDSFGKATMDLLKSVLPCIVSSEPKLLNTSHSCQTLHFKLTCFQRYPTRLQQKHYKSGLFLIVKFQAFYWVISIGIQNKEIRPR